MKLLLLREDLTDECVIGKLYVDGVFECYTLEDIPRDEKVKHKTCIPLGTYRVVITHSARFNQLMPLLLNVPEFDGIRIHPGNTAAHTSGCILVGRARGTNRISESKVAYQALFKKLNAAYAKGEKLSIDIDVSDKMIEPVVPW